MSAVLITGVVSIIVFIAIAVAKPGKSIFG